MNGRLLGAPFFVSAHVNNGHSFGPRVVFFL